MVAPNTATRLLAAFALALGAAAILWPAHATAVNTRVGIAGSSSINAHEGAPTPIRQARLQSRTGANLARITINWNVVQGAGPRSYNFSRYDRTVRALIKKGIKPVVVLTRAPHWAREGFPGCNKKRYCPPQKRHFDAFARLAVEVARRYPKVHAIEVWNEPNRIGGWGGSGGPDPEAYADLFRVTAAALRGRFPKLHILFGSNGYVPPSDRAGNQPIPEFLNGLYDNLTPRDLSGRVGLSLHIYPGPRELGGLLPQGQFNTAMAQARRVRDARDPGRRLWITETGVSTTAKTSGGSLVNEVQQARTIANVLGQLRPAADVRAVFIFTLYDRPHDPAKPIESGYGLIKLGSKLDPKRSYCRLASELGRRPRGC